MSSMQQDKIDQIKKIIRERYNEMDIQSQIRDLIAEKLSESSPIQANQSSLIRMSSENNAAAAGKQPLSHEMIIDEMKRKGLLDSLLNGLKSDKHVSSTTTTTFYNNNNNNNNNNINERPTRDHHVQMPSSALRASTSATSQQSQQFVLPLNKHAIDASKRYLYLQLLNGRAFLDYLNEADELDVSGVLPMSGLHQQQQQQHRSFFTIYVHWREQRFKTKPFACTCDPAINEGFLIELHSNTNKQDTGFPATVGLIAEPSGLLAASDPIHICMTRTDANQDTHLVSSNFFEWRTALTFAHGKQLFAIEMMGTGGTAECQLAAGVLNVCVQLVPGLAEPVREELLGTQLGIEHAKSTERERLFLIYAKAWWKEYLDIRDDHRNRLVKIFAQDENGTNRSVCSFVRPMRTGRLLDTPRQAARFVSLIGYDKEQTSFARAADHAAEPWLHLHTFLAKSRGNTANHALLLCNLLLGFGLDAYVCVGTVKQSSASNASSEQQRAHTWVVTMSHNQSEVIFWEAVSGNRYMHVPIDDAATAAPLDKRLGYVVRQHPYDTLGCVFNHRSFYANVQPVASVDACSLRLADQAKWKAMSEDAIATVCSVGGGPMSHLLPLCGSTLDASLAASDLESQLRSLVAIQRKELGLSTSWDEGLSYVLTQALASYETERTTGLASVGNEEFDQAIKLAIPDGHSFKAFPIQLVHRNARKAFAAMLKAPVCSDIVACKGDQVKMAIRVRIFTYPENTVATWIMLACRYKLIL